jgi:hypothetical protein
MKRLLLLSILLTGPAVLLHGVEPASPGVQPKPPQIASPSATESLAYSQSQAEQSESFDKMEIRPAADICYRIRAYIFRRDDDHAPKLVGSTTCGPIRPQTHNTKGFVPLLVPADSTSPTD